MILLIQSGHKFAHAMAAPQPWHVQSCDLISSLFVKLEQHEFFQDLNYEMFCDMTARPQWICFHSQPKAADIYFEGHDEKYS